MMMNIFDQTLSSFFCGFTYIIFKAFQVERIVHQNRFQLSRDKNCQRNPSSEFDFNL